MKPVPIVPRALSLFLFWCAATTAIAAPPNIILFLADDMGMGDTSVYQDWTENPASKQIHTPNLERLAAQGLRFTNAHAPSSRCSPTRYALLTGRYCWRTRLKHWVLFGVHCPPLIDRETLTLPEFLHDVGYQSGLIGKWHLGLTYSTKDGSPAAGWEDADLSRPLLDGPLDHGFDRFYGISRSHGTSGPNTHSKIANTPDQQRGPGWMSDRSIVGATGEGKQLDGGYILREIAPALRREATAFMNDAGKQRAPFFLYFASPANHAPYTPCQELGGQTIAGASRYQDGTRTESARLDFVHENDVQVGLLLDYLEETEDPRQPDQKLIANTLFVFASDNGAEVKHKTATGPLRSFKGSIYEGGHRIPFLVSWPDGGIPKGRSTGQLLGLNDLYATIAEALDVILPSAAAPDSFSQWETFQGETTAPPRTPLFVNDHKEATKKRSDERAWVAVIGQDGTLPQAGSWKLFLDHRFAYNGQLHPQELYFLTNDPKEERNRLNDLRARLAQKHLLSCAEAARGDDGRTRLVKAEPEIGTSPR